MAYKKIIGIYKITSPTGKVYIGKSKNINQRLNNYRQIDKCKSQTRLYNSLKKHGAETHIFEILEECGVSDLYCRERFWQDEFDVLSENGLNCILSECRAHPAEIRDDTRQKMSDSMKGENNPMYGRDWRAGKTQEELDLHSKRISEALKGVVFSDEHRAKLGLKGELHPFYGLRGKDSPSFGSKRSEETKQKISERMSGENHHMFGKKQKPETIEKRIKTIQKAVINILTFEEVDSVKELSIILNMRPATLQCQLNGSNYNTTDWVYKEDIDKPINRKPEKVRFTDEELKILRENTKSYLNKNYKNLYRRYIKYNPDNKVFTSEKYTEKILINIIKDCPYKSQLFKECPGAYIAINKRFPHLMELLISSRVNWTEKLVIEEIEKCGSFKEFYNNKKLYLVVHKRFRHLLELVKKKNK